MNSFMRLTRAVLLPLSVVAFAQPVMAQSLVYSDKAVQSCVDGATNSRMGDPGECIGVSAFACMENTPGGESTAATSGCFERELDYWDDQLNLAYAEVRQSDRQTDKDNLELGLQVPNLEENLKLMQRAWIPYRDATCDYEHAGWGNGTGGAPALLGCLMEMTGRQALYLRNRLVQQ